MILVDTSIWIDHLRTGDARLVGLLERSEVLTHSMVIGELALGSIHPRGVLLDSLEALPRAVEASHAEVRHLIESRRLDGRGIGLVDAHLLAATHTDPTADPGALGRPRTVSRVPYHRGHDDGAPP